MASGSGIVQIPCMNPITAAPISILPATKKQRFIDGMRVVLNIAKESADACPPLKSCLGGIEALIKHYDVGSVERKLDRTDGFTSGIQGRQRQTQ